MSEQVRIIIADMTGVITRREEIRIKVSPDATDKQINIALENKFLEVFGLYVQLSNGQSPEITENDILEDYIGDSKEDEYEDEDV